MRRISVYLLSLAGVCCFSGMASAFHHRPFCCKYAVPVVPVVPSGSYGSFGTIGFGAVTPGFGTAYGFGGVTPGYGAVVPGYGYGFGLVPLTGGATRQGGFGGIDDEGFGADPATIALLVREILGGIRAARSGGDTSRIPPRTTPAPGTATTGTQPAPGLAEINLKLDAILVNQSVSTTAILTALKEHHEHSDKRLNDVLDQLKAIKAQTDKIK